MLLPIKLYISFLRNEYILGFNCDIYFCLKVSFKPYCADTFIRLIQVLQNVHTYQQVGSIPKLGMSLGHTPFFQKLQR